MKNVTYDVCGIKRDNCDKKDMTIQFEDYPKWINKSCPECGSNLLSRKEYDHCLNMASIVDIINQIDLPDNKELDKEVKMEIEFKDNKPYFKIIK